MADFVGDGPADPVFFSAGVIDQHVAAFMAHAQGFGFGPVLAEGEGVITALLPQFLPGTDMAFFLEFFQDGKGVNGKARDAQFCQEFAGLLGSSGEVRASGDFFSFLHRPKTSPCVLPSFRSPRLPGPGFWQGRRRFSAGSPAAWGS